MTQITLSSEQVLQIAAEIHSDNVELLELLKTSKATVDSLSSYWTGTAASETQSSYEAFANQYFDSYYNILEQYVEFLRVNVAEHYEETERVDTQLADAFK